MNVKLYGLKNCDTCHKAMKALTTAGLAHDFVDMRVDGVTAEQVNDWAETVGWKSLLNTKSTTWRGLPDAEKADVDEAYAVKLMCEHPTLIKRPVIDAGGSVTVGWTKDVQAELGV